MESRERQRDMEPFLSVIAYNIWHADRLERNKIIKEVIKITMFQRSYDPV